MKNAYFYELNKVKTGKGAGYEGIVMTWLSMDEKILYS